MIAHPEGREPFRQEVLEWAKRIGVSPRQIHLRPMKRKWGSCSTSGRLTFNIELLGQPVHTRSEVIVHELLHLKVPNHGPLFRSLERAYLKGAPRTRRRVAGASVGLTGTHRFLSHGERSLSLCPRT